MSLLSALQPSVGSFRVIPPTREPANDNQDRSEAIESQQHPPILQITSYDRHEPPNPKPDLEYDCRLTKNPSKQAGPTRTGLDNEVQNELMGRAEFSDLVSTAEDEIRRMMEVKDARAKSKDDKIIVNVGCICGSGHHRSVAFAEQLGKIEWPSDWDVRVRHRDLTSSIKTKKETRKL
ncbi:hypothetical protein BKA66DRAFT_452582, partial [Pyrenochaeta sp. MPI-SDFR-AT-0127]